MLQRYETGKRSRTIPPAAERNTSFLFAFSYFFLVSHPFFLSLVRFLKFKLFVRNRGKDLLFPDDSYLRLVPHDPGRTPGGSGCRPHFYVTDAIRVFPPNDFHRDERTLKGKTRASWVSRDDTPRLSLESTPPFVFLTT